MKALGQYPTDLYDRMLWECTHLGEFSPRTIAEKDSLELDTGKLVILGWTCNSTNHGQ